MNKLSKEIKSGSLDELLASCVNYECYCSFGKIPMDLLDSSWEKSPTLSLGGRAEMMSTVIMQSCSMKNDMHISSLVRAACQMEISMMQKCKMTPDGDNDADLTHNMRAIQKQVREDEKLLRERVMHLSGDAWIERMKNALSDTRITYFNAKENGSPVSLQTSHLPPSSSSLATSTADSEKRNRTEEPSRRVVRALFKDDDSKPSLKDEMLSMEND